MRTDAKPPARTERGASAVEYGLLLSGIAALIAVAILLFGGSVLNLFQSTCDQVASAQHSTCQ